MNIRTPFNYDPDEASRLTAWCSDEPSMTQQQFKDECDINTIVRLFGLTGKMPAGVYQPTYDDFTEVDDFQGSLHAIQRATAAFMELPAHIRERFQNNPAHFVDFCSDVRNAEELKSWNVSKDVPPPIKPEPSPTAPTPTSPV